MVHHTKCPLCSSEKIGLHFTCTDYFVSKTNFEVFKCSECDFRFTQNYPEEVDIARFYESDDYISHSDTSEGLSNKLYRIARRLMLAKKRNLIGSVTGLKTGCILDIGSGTGYFANEMKKAGWHSEGIEINEKARNFSKSHFGLEVNSPDYLSALKAESYDCITLWHVLEHFHDPFKYVSDIYRLLRPGAFCVIALPNCSSFDAAYYKGFWAAWDVPRHLWHFSPSTFRLFSDKTDFVLKSIRTLPLDVFYISLLSEKYTGSISPFINGITKAAKFAFLSALNKNRSSSVIYILEKKKIS
jgi:2-polyprenyl-3-methyl-5-hydroxy-6-metoxy-1,4-benzoquinol methylase